MEDLLIGLFVPLGICVVLPVMIVWIVFRTSRNADDKRAEVLLAAINSGKTVDADKLAEALGRPRKSPREILNSRLQRGIMFSLMGIMLAVITAAEIIKDEETLMIMWLIAAVLTSVGAGNLAVYFATRRKVEEDEKKEKEERAAREADCK